jgi:hypothetical protein
MQALQQAVPNGFHVQVSYAREAHQKNIPYTYGAPVRAEDIMSTPRAPLVMQPEVAFVPTAGNAATPSADDVPVYSNTPIPQPARSNFASFAEADAELVLESGLDASADFAAAAATDVEADTSGGATQSLDAAIESAEDFAAELDAVLENGDKDALEREKQDKAFQAMRGGAATNADEELYTIHQASFVETGAEAGVATEVSAEASAAAELDAELDAEVAEDLDLEAETEADAEAEAEHESELEADAEAAEEAEFESEFDA